MLKTSLGWTATFAGKGCLGTWRSWHHRCPKFPLKLINQATGNAGHDDDTPEKTRSGTSGSVFCIHIDHNSWSLRWFFGLGSGQLPSGNDCYIAIENGHLWWMFPLKVVIFHSHVYQRVYLNIWRSWIWQFFHHRNIDQYSSDLCSNCCNHPSSTYIQIYMSSRLVFESGTSSNWCFTGGNCVFFPQVNNMTWGSWFRFSDVGGRWWNIIS